MTLAPFAGVGAAPVAIEHDMPTRRLPGVGSLGPGIDTEATIVDTLRKIESTPKTEPPADAEDTSPHPLTEKTQPPNDEAVVAPEPLPLPVPEPAPAPVAVEVAPPVEIKVELEAAPTQAVVVDVAVAVVDVKADVVAEDAAVDVDIEDDPDFVPADDGPVLAPVAVVDPVVPVLAAAVAAPEAPSLAELVDEAAFAAGPPAASDPVDWMVGAQTDRFNLEDILASEADSLVLGDISDVVQSFRVRTRSKDMPGIGVAPGEPGAAEASSAPASSMEVFVGGDIARLLAADVVLKKRENPPDSGQLSPFEMFVLKQIDGVRNVGEVQAHMRLSDGDLRIVLALLVDKKLVELAAPLPEKTTQQPAEQSEDSLDLDVDDSSPVPADEMGLDLSPILTPPKARAISVPPSAPVLEPPLPAPPKTPAPSSSPSSSEAPPPPPPSNARPAFAPQPAPLASPAFTGLPPPPSAPVLLGLPGQPLPQALQAQQPKKSTTSQEVAVPRPAPTSLSPGSAALRAGLLIAGDHTKAAAFHAQCIRELKNGSVEKANQLARQALNAAPDITLYRDTLAEWPAFVAAHRTPDDVRAKAQAVLAEEAGDFDKAIALLKTSVQTNPKNAAAWNRLAVLLATRKNDILGAVDAAQKAVELVPDDATYLSNFTKFAALADKRGGLDKNKRGLWNRLLGK